MIPPGATAIVGAAESTEIGTVPDVSSAGLAIDAAANAGANFAKFQTFRADRLVMDRAPKAEYQVSLTKNAETQHAMLQKLL